MTLPQIFWSVGVTFNKTPASARSSSIISSAVRGLKPGHWREERQQLLCSLQQGRTIIYQGAPVTQQRALALVDQVQYGEKVQGREVEDKERLNGLCT